MQKRILVVDDETDFLELVKLRLKSHNYACTVATTPEEGLEKAKNLSPNLILLDIMLPRINGLEVLQQLQSSLKTRDIPVVILTALSQQALVQEAFDKGAKGYLCKTCSPEELLFMVQEYATSPEPETTPTLRKPMRTRAQKLEGESLERYTQYLDPNWNMVDAHHLEREFDCQTFAEGLAFSKKLGDLAELLNHHPDLHLRGGKVRVQIWSHSAQGLTPLDFEWAQKAEAIFREK